MDVIRVVAKYIDENMSHFYFGNFHSYLNPLFKRNK